GCARSDRGPGMWRYVASRARVSESMVPVPTGKDHAMTVRSMTFGTSGRAWGHAFRFACLAAALAGAVLVPACSGDDNDGAGGAGGGGAGGVGGTGGLQEGGVCLDGGGGPVPSDGGGDMHCVDSEGGTITQMVGACRSDVAFDATAGGGNESFTIRYGNEGD